MVYRSEKGSFGRYLKKYDTGTLKHINIKRVKTRKFIQIERKIMAYIELQKRDISKIRVVLLGFS